MSGAHLHEPQARAWITEQETGPASLTCWAADMSGACILILDPRARAWPTDQETYRARIHTCPARNMPSWWHFARFFVLDPDWARDLSSMDSALSLKWEGSRSQWGQNLLEVFSLWFLCIVKIFLSFNFWTPRYFEIVLSICICKMQIRPQIYFAPFSYSYYLTNHRRLAPKYLRKIVTLYYV